MLKSALWCCGDQPVDVHPQACARLEGEAAAAVQREAERRAAEGRLQEEATMLRRTLGAARRPPRLHAEDPCSTALEMGC